MSDTPQASAGGTEAVGEVPARGGSIGVRPVAAGLAVVVLALALLAWAKYVPYSAKVPHVLDTHTLGGSILTGDGAGVPEASLAAGWDFTVAYLDSIWKALLAGLVLAAAVQVLLPAPWLTRALGRSDGTAGGVRGGLWSVLTLMCSCCAAPVAVGLRRLKANLPATVAFWLGNPALNPVVLVFCLAVLPWPWAVLRLAAGLAVVAAGIAAARREERRPVGPAVAPVAVVTEAEPAPEGGLALRFARALGGLSARLVPELVAVVFVLGAFRGVLFPIGADVPGAAILAVSLVIAGLLLPVPTGGEVAVVAAVLAAGMPVAAAAVLLVTLPMLSLPSVLMVRSVVPRRVLERTVAAAAAVGLLAAAVAPALA
jgi:uncharacterized membrane protein YraQ (UPF0718 family)